MLHKYCNCKKTFFIKLLLIPEEVETELSTFNTGQARQQYPASILNSTAGLWCCCRALFHSS